MQNEYNHIDLLIANCLSGEASQSEKDELNRWIGESPANKRIFEESQRIWAKSQTYFSSTEISSDREKIKDQIIQQLSKPTKTVSLSTWIYRVAAILALPVMLGIGWYLGSTETNSETQMCEVTAPKGQISKCVLADGTEVWLNAGTTIKYDPSLKGDFREVMLDGEAYFKVSKNKHKPFTVTTEHAQIKVLGTTFNLKAFSGENKVETTLEEGSVVFSLNGSATKPVELKPGEQLVYSVSEKTITLGKVETYLHTAWKDGKFVFKDADLQTIIQELEKLYDVRIHLENDSLLKLRFRGMFEYEENIFSALEALERTTNMKYRMKGRDIWLQ
jgi:ferric-dicitrate binding protein FerR (iron transport regulator)